MVFRGSIILFIGLLLKESSPARTVAKGWEDRSPASRRIVVPEFPQYRTLVGSLNPLSPRPVTDRLWPFLLTVIPNCSKHLQVLAVSSAGRKFWIRLSPVAKAERIAALWEMDLSGATVISPLKGFDCFMVILIFSPYLIHAFIE
jgi:hypothetical protein